MSSLNEWKNKLIERIPYRDYSFINHPVEASLKDYEDAKKEFVSRYSGIKDVISIYNYGGKIKPGLSDLDFILVLKDKVKHGNHADFFPRKFSYYVVHQPLILNAELMKNANCLIILFQLKNCFGRDIRIKKPGERTDNKYKLAIIHTIILLFLPRFFLRLLMKKKINTRQALVHIKTLRYTLLLFSAISNNPGCLTKRHKEYINNVESLRKNWFDLGREKYSMLFNLIKESVYISMDFIELYSDYLTKCCLVQDIEEIRKSNNIIFTGHGKYCFFLDKWDKEEVLDYLIRFYRKSCIHYRLALNILPLQMAAPLVQYSQGGSELSRYIRNNLAINGAKWRLKDPSAYRRKMELMDSMIHFFKKNNFSSTVYPIFGFKIKRTYSNRIKDFIARKIAEHYFRNLPS